MATPLFTYSQNQIYFSELWDQDGGEVAFFYRNSTTTDDMQNVYTVGSTLNSNNNHDIIIQKFDPDGGVLWQKTFNGAANMDDMAADLFVDEAYNVYVTGTSVENTTNTNDLVVLKYNYQGDFQWSSYYDNGGNPTPKDAGTAITGDNDGNIYVTGTSFGQSSSLADYVTLRLDASNGSQLWESRYDYNELNDVPAKIKLEGDNLYVAGGSQATFNKWELATVFYEASNGNQVHVRRSQGNATAGVDEVYDLTLDDAGNVYITGAVVNENTGYDISVYKLDPLLNILWEKQYDGYSGDDRGKGIKVDNQGNVYVAGFVSNPNQGKNYALLKYNSTGTFQWSREFNGEANLDDEAMQLVIDSNQGIFVTGSAINNTHAEIQTIGYKPNGEIFTQAVFEETQGYDAKPTGITQDIAKNLIVVGQIDIPNGNHKNITVKYNLIEKPFDPVMVNGEPSHNANEVIIRFDRSAVKYGAIDRKAFIAGQLEDFVKPSVVSAMSEKLGVKVSRLNTFKIFTNTTSADSLSITRLGDTVKVQDFWATLSVFFPESLDLNVVIDSLKQLKEHLYYAHQNHAGEYLSTTNDPIYNFAYPDGQTGLFDLIHGINVNEAWDKQSGFDLVNVGVFDTGINWRHEDFGDGTPSGTKVKGGRDYTGGPTGVHPHSQSTPDPGGHGTALAGIIGAIRNNGKGIAGIAGGDFGSTGNTGVSLYSFRHTLLTTDVCHAVKAGVIGTEETGNGYGLDIINISFSTMHSALLRETFKAVYDQGVIVSASSGDGNNSNNVYPSSFEDKWILRVGANDSTGTRVSHSTYGENLDFLAPGTRDLYATLDNWGISGYSYQDDGTSYAAPHATGVAALMVSEHHPQRDPFYPNMLGPEDVDEILKRTATPVKKDFSFSPNPGSLPVPNEYAGHGRIDAGEAVEKISAPYMVHHFDRFVNTNTATFYDSTQTINYPEGVEGITNAGYDIGNTHIYKLTSTFPIVSYDPNTFLDVWARNSSGDLYGLTDTIYKEQWGGTVIDTVINNEITMTGYLYKVEIVDGGVVTGHKWLPTDNFSTIKFAYSHYKNLGSLSTDKEFDKKDEVNLYPNPTDDEINFSLNLTSRNLQVEIYDITGKRIKNIEYSDINNDQYHNTIDVSKFSKGLYFCKFDTGEEQFTKKFIKH